MILIPSNVQEKINVLVGDAHAVSNTPTVVFDPLRINFLSELSKSLFAQETFSSLPDVASFAYWCRRTNLISLENRLGNSKLLQVGLGLSFHICPSNVPVNFAFSLAFGLLAGNTCVLRLPSKQSVTVETILQSINALLQKPEFNDLKTAILLIQYEHDEWVSEFWLSAADGKVFWGGDETIDYMRSLKCRPRSREVAFSDRYSVCAIYAPDVLELNAENLQKFGHQLFNDIYLMDQAACSSPQLVVWIGNAELVSQAKKKVWDMVVSIALKKYKPDSLHLMDKFVNACMHAIKNDQVLDVVQHSHVLYRIELKNLSKDQDTCRGWYGTVHEVTLSSLDLLAPIVTEKYQTLSYFGFSADQLASFVLSNKLRGIDRVVPVGSALDIDLVWDGYNIISSLSRRIEIKQTRGIS